MKKIPTVDPDVFIEAKRPSYIRYWRQSDNRRWEVHGECKKIGECVIGAVLPDGHMITGLDDPRLHEADMSPLDVPTTPEFDICCAARGYLTFIELKPGDYQPD